MSKKMKTRNDYIHLSSNQVFPLDLQLLVYYESVYITKSLVHNQINAKKKGWILYCTLSDV